MESHQRLQRSVVQLLAVIRGIDELRMQIAIDHARRQIGDLPNVIAQNVESRAFRQPLWYRDDGNEDDRRDQRGEKQYA